MTEDQDTADERAQLEETVAHLAEKIRQGKAEYLRGQKALQVAADAELEATLDAMAGRIAEAEAGHAELTALLEQAPAPPQPQPLAIAEAGQLLRDIGAGAEALASFEADPEGMTGRINFIRCSPLDLATKQAIIADATAGEAGQP